MSELPEPRGRPRILVSDDDFERVERLIGDDPHATAWYGTLEARGGELLDEPPREYEIPDGLRLLSVSRAVYRRARELGALYRLTGAERYAERLWDELAAAADFPDWNPRHFLDTAEMTAAFAVGYDWLHGYWSDDRRATLRDAMLEHGLEQALPGYRGEAGGGEDRPNTWWTEATHNWNTVCNGGISMGALALLGDAPDAPLAAVIEGARESIASAVAELAPNGGWAEGIGYWGYNARYLAYYLSSLRHTLGTDFGYLGSPGVDGIGDFPLFLTAPDGQPFNFCDSHAEGRVDASELFWFARQFDRPEWAGYQRRTVGEDGGVQDLLWYDPTTVADPETAGLDRDKRFPGAEDSVTFRQGWNDPDAAFLGAKAGDNQVNHGDLDLGTFVFSSRGVEWATDLGANDYNVPDYWDMGADGGRWRYYRKRAEGHNVPVIDPGEGPDQDPFATASMVRVETGPDAALAITDLSDAYPAAVERGVALTAGRSQLLVQDEIAAREPVDVWWFMHTPAAIDVDGRTATLRADGERLRVGIESPADAAFEAMDAAPLPGSPQPTEEAPVEGTRKLAIRCPDATDLTIAVWAGGEIDLDAPTPLAEWSAGH